MAIAFDTLAYANRLKEAGVPDKQAETQAEALAEIVEERLATKTDIAALQRDIEELELRLTYKLTIRMGSMITAAVGILAALMLFLDK